MHSWIALPQSLLKNHVEPFLKEDEVRYLNNEIPHYLSDFDFSRSQLVDIRKRKLHGLCDPPWLFRAACLFEDVALLEELQFTDSELLFTPDRLKTPHTSVEVLQWTYDRCCRSQSLVWNVEKFLNFTGIHSRATCEWFLTKELATTSEIPWVEIGLRNGDVELLDYMLDTIQCFVLPISLVVLTGFPIAKRQLDAIQWLSDTTTHRMMNIFTTLLMCDIVDPFAFQEFVRRNEIHSVPCSGLITIEYDVIVWLIETRKCTLNEDALAAMLRIHRYNDVAKLIALVGTDISDYNKVHEFHYCDTESLYQASASYRHYVQDYVDMRKIVSYEDWKWLKSKKPSCCISLLSSSIAMCKYMQSEDDFKKLMSNHVCNEAIVKRFLNILDNVYAERDSEIVTWIIDYLLANPIPLQYRFLYISNFSALRHPCPKFIVCFLHYDSAKIMFNGRDLQEAMGRKDYDLEIWKKIRPRVILSAIFSVLYFSGQNYRAIEFWAQLFPFIPEDHDAIMDSIMHAPLCNSCRMTSALRRTLEPSNHKFILFYRHLFMQHEWFTTKYKRVLQCFDST